MSFEDKNPTILIITNLLPYPLNVGGKIRIYKLFKLLSDRFNFILLSLIKDEKEIQYIPNLNKVFKEAHLVIKRSKPKSLFYPISYFGSYSRYLIKKFKEILENFSIDIIHIESNELLYLTEYIKEIPIIYTELDASALSLTHSYYPPLSSYITYFFDYLKRIYYHKNFYKNLTAIITLSENDKRFIKLFIKDKPIYCIPTGVDLDYFSFEFNKNTSKKLIFVGWYGHYPNEDAVIFFSRRIFPLVKKRFSDIEFLILGHEPTERIKMLVNNNGIRLIGSVKDIRPYLRESLVFVNPIRLGTGIKGKVLEAMAVGLPVVSTKEGLYGIEAEDFKEVMIANNDREFVEKLALLIENSDLRYKLAINARKLVEKSYNWKDISKILDNLYNLFL